MVTSLLFEQHSPEIKKHQQAGRFTCHTLSSLGFKRSEQAENAGYVLVRPSKKNRQHTSPAYWISAGEMASFMQCCHEVSEQRKIPRANKQRVPQQPSPSEYQPSVQQWCQTQFSPAASLIKMCRTKKGVVCTVDTFVDFVLPELKPFNIALQWSFVLSDTPQKHPSELAEQQAAYAQRVSEWSLLLQAASYWEPFFPGVSMLFHEVFSESKKAGISVPCELLSFGEQILRQRIDIRQMFQNDIASLNAMNIQWLENEHVFAWSIHVPAVDVSVTYPSAWTLLSEWLMNPRWDASPTQTLDEYQHIIVKKQTELVEKRYLDAIQKVCSQISSTVPSEEVRKFFTRVMPRHVRESQLLVKLEQTTEQALAYFRLWLSMDELVGKFGVDWVVSRYRAARAIKRKITIFAGPTNSGKTYRAFESAKDAESVNFLAPLRLLAMEGYDRLCAAYGSACLMTGEERLGDLQSRFVASTVEMCDPTRLVDVAIIDEAQMLADPDRGSAWTAALLGVAAKHVYLTCPEEAVPMLRSLFALTGEPVEVVCLERKSTLQILQNPVPFAQIKPGTAVVAFSRRQLLSYKEAFEAKGMRCALVYGALSPDVRRHQAALFTSGQADILLSTDAIAMGLNLPVRQVVIAEHQKFNGVEVASVPNALLRQIAGRAGRYGIVENGSAAGISGQTHQALRSAFAKIEPFELAKFPVTLDQMMVQLVAKTIHSEKLQDIEAHFSEIIACSTSEFVGKFSDMQLMLFREIDQFKGCGLSLTDKFRASCAPVNKDNYGQWLRWFHVLSRNDVVPLPNFSRNTSKVAEVQTLNDKEQAINTLNLYRWLHYQFPKNFPEIEAATQMITVIDAQITTLLQQTLKKRCSSCGCILKPMWQHGRCDDCFQSREWY